MHQRSTRAMPVVELWTADMQHRPCKETRKLYSAAFSLSLQCSIANHKHRLGLHGCKWRVHMEQKVLSIAVVIQPLLYSGHCIGCNPQVVAIHRSFYSCSRALLSSCAMAWIYDSILWCHFQLLLIMLSTLVLTIHKVGGGNFRNGTTLKSQPRCTDQK